MNMPDLPPIDLLTAPSDQDIDAGEAQLDRLGNSLIETLRTFKVEGRPGPRTTGPVIPDERRGRRVPDRVDPRLGPVDHRYPLRPGRFECR